MKHIPKSRRGSVLIAVIIVAMIIGSISGIYLETATSEFKSAMRSLTLQKSMNVAESGAEEALYALNNADFSGWDELQSNVYYRTLSTDGSRGEVFRTYVCVDYRNSARPIVYVQGEIDGKQFDVNKQLHIELGSRSLFANGLTARKKIVFNGNNTAIDSYTSSKGSYNSSTNRNDNGSIASASTENNDVLVNHADIWGYVSTGGPNPKVGKNGSVRGEDTPSGVRIDNNRIARDFTADFQIIEPPSVAATPISPTATSLGTAGSTTYYITETLLGLDYDYEPNGDVTVSGDVVLIATDDVDMGNNDLTINANSKITIYLADDFRSAGGHAIVNSTMIPANCVIIGTSTSTSNTQEISISGNASAAYAVYAPNADVTFNGGGGSGSVFGAVVANNITFNGTYDFHYDEDLQNYGGSGSFQLEYWRELIQEDEKLPLADKTEMNTFVSST